MNTMQLETPGGNPGVATTAVLWQLCMADLNDVTELKIGSFIC